MTHTAGLAQATWLSCSFTKCVSECDAITDLLISKGYKSVAKLFMPTMVVRIGPCMSPEPDAGTPRGMRRATRRISRHELLCLSSCCLGDGTMDKRLREELAARRRALFVFASRDLRQNLGPIASFGQPIAAISVAISRFRCQNHDNNISFHCFVAYLFNGHEARATRSNGRSSCRSREHG